MEFDLAYIRQEYVKRELSPGECLPDAMAQLEVWLQEAIKAQVEEPTAMNLASVGMDGRPSARMVLLKGLEGGQLVFYTHYHSRKGRQLAMNPYVALTFFWPQLERQIRVEGVAAPVAPAVSDAYFATRPYTSQLGAWASEQSREIASKTKLLARVAKYGAQYPLNVPRPLHWGGYSVTPHQIEFWQGRPSRLHDRVLYTLDNGAWHQSRLAP